MQNIQLNWVWLLGFSLGSCTLASFAILFAPRSGRVGELHKSLESGSALNVLHV